MGGRNETGGLQIDIKNDGWIKALLSNMQSEGWHSNLSCTNLTEPFWNHHPAIFPRDRGTLVAMFRRPAERLISAFKFGICNVPHWNQKLSSCKNPRQWILGNPLQRRRGGKAKGKGKACNQTASKESNEQSLAQDR